MQPRTKPPRERQAELLDAAEELFVEKGIAATTIEEITSRAGVGKGSFYLHYKSKDDLVAALQDRFSDRLAGELAAAAAAKADWGAKLDALVGAFHATYTRQVELHDVLYYHAPLLDREPSSEIAHARDVIRDVLAAGADAGAYRVDAVDLTALLVYSAVHGAFEAAPNGRRPPRAAIIRAARQLVRRAAGLGDPS